MIPTGGAVVRISKPPMKISNFSRGFWLTIAIFFLPSLTILTQAQENTTPPIALSPTAPVALPEGAAPSPKIEANGPIYDTIQTEDVIQVIVVNHPEFSLDNVVVQNNGTVPLPVVGALKVDGKTPAEAATLITDKLKKQLRQPRVTVVIRQSRPRRIFVLGAVARPGTYDLPRNAGVAEALALAGGGAPKAALSQATIKRADGTVLPIDLLKAGSQTEANIMLQPGDVLVVPESQARYTIRGAVAKPGVFDLAEGTSITVSDAIAQSGGVLPRAALSRARITRADGTEVPVDLYKAVILGQPDANLTLNSGDVLTVPVGAGVTILGAVQRPGILNLEAGTITLAEALAQSGGLAVPPTQARISLSRTGADGQTQISTIDAASLMNLRDPTQNVTLQEGDLVSIASKDAQTVFISGEVKNPGAYELKEGDSVPELIVKAGGALPEAALTQISVVKRDGTAHLVDAANAIKEGGDRGKDFPLQQGDFVVVPENKNAVLVLGAVAQPGRKMIPENAPLTLGNALAAAGGAKDRARITQILLLNEDKKAPDGVQRRIVRLDGSKGGELTLNEPLAPGTLVYVPDAKDANRGPLGLLSSLSTAFALLFRR